LKNHVSGCDVPGVRQCWALQARLGMLPSLRLTIRTPNCAGD
jgi:hypothetical protein